MRHPYFAVCLAAALVIGCATPQPAPAPTVPASLVAVGVPRGDEPPGWEDLRDVPFELHLVGRDPDWPTHLPPSLMLELRPGGRVESAEDGTRLLPTRLFRERVIDRSIVHSEFGSGYGRLVAVPYGGWEAAVPVPIPEGTRERVIRAITLDLVLIRIAGEEVREATLEAGGVIHPVPAPFDGRLEAGKWFIDLTDAGDPGDAVHPAVPAPREESPFDDVMDLIEMRDAVGRRITWSGSVGLGGSCTRMFSFHRELPGDIAYPVRVRFRNPSGWSRRTYRFEIRDLPIPE